MDSENKIGLARRVMVLFLKSLPMGCRVNIIRFGSRYQNLFDDIPQRFPMKAMLTKRNTLSRERMQIWAVLSW